MNNHHMGNFSDLVYINAIKSKFLFHLSYDVVSSDVYCSNKIRLWVIAKLLDVGIEILDNQIASTFIFSIKASNPSTKNTSIINSVFDYLASMKNGIKYHLSVIHPYDVGRKSLRDNNGVEKKDSTLLDNIKTVKGKEEYLLLENALKKS